MGSLATHFSTFLFLSPIGFRRLLWSSSLYLKNRNQYRSKPWFFSQPKWRNLDLYALLIALPISSFADLFLFLSLSGHPSYRFAFLEQATVNLFFWALLIVIVYREYIDTIFVNESYVFILAGISFLIEYFMNGNGFTGVSANAYQLFGGLTLICACCCFCLSVRPTTFFAEFFLSSALIFKGVWILQVGLNLYTDMFSLKGCQKVSLLSNKDDVDVKCDLVEDIWRGVALMNLLFVGHTIGVMITVVGLFALLSSNQNLRCCDAGGPLLENLDSECELMRSVPQTQFDDGFDS